MISMEAAEVMKSIHMEERILDYIVEIVRATRNPGKLDGEMASMISYGASPRASSGWAWHPGPTRFLTAGDM